MLTVRKYLIPPHFSMHAAVRMHLTFAFVGCMHANRAYLFNLTACKQVTFIYTFGMHAILRTHSTSAVVYPQLFILCDIQRK
jgi:hypothetical protein